MKLYLLYKTNSQEGNFGDCEQAPSILCGVFENEPSAVLAKLDLEKSCYTQKHQFGEHTQEIIMLQIESNKILDIVME